MVERLEDGFFFFFVKMSWRERILVCNITLNPIFYLILYFSLLRKKFMLTKMCLFYTPYLEKAAREGVLWSIETSFLMFEADYLW